MKVCVKALIKNTISCSKIHIMKALSPVHLIAMQMLCNSADTLVIIITRV